MRADNEFMRLALDAALWAYDDCGRVGAVVVHAGRILSGMGRDIRTGTHAQYNALLATGWIGSENRKPGSVVYVTYQRCLKRSDPKKKLLL